MTPDDRKKFRAMVDWLRDEFPLRLPVWVRSVPYKRLYGTASHDDTRFYINVKRDQDWAGLQDTLIHEWAHCLTPWDEYPDHGHEWAANYGEIYRRWHGEDEED